MSRSCSPKASLFAVERLERAFAGRSAKAIKRSERFEKHLRHIVPKDATRRQRKRAWCALRHGRVHAGVLTGGRCPERMRCPGDRRALCGAII